MIRQYGNGWPVLESLFSKSHAGRLETEMHRYCADVAEEYIEAVQREAASPRRGPEPVGGLAQMFRVNKRGHRLFDTGALFHRMVLVKTSKGYTGGFDAVKSGSQAFRIARLQIRGGQVVVTERMHAFFRAILHEVRQRSRGQGTGTGKAGRLVRRMSSEQVAEYLAAPALPAVGSKIDVPSDNILEFVAESMLMTQRQELIARGLDVIRRVLREGVR